MFKQRRLVAFRKGIVQYTTYQVKQAQVRLTTFMPPTISAATQEQYQMWKDLLTALKADK